MSPDPAPSARRQRHMLVAAAIAAATAGPAPAQDIIDGQVKLIPRQESATIGFTNGSFVAAPIPFRNPTIGTGLALGGGYLFKDEARSATSFLGAGGFKTDNGSYGYGLAGNVVLGDNRWKMSAFLGHVELTYDLYTALGIAEIDQSGSLAKVELAYGVTPELSFGVIGRYLDTTIESDRTVPAEILADLGDATVTGIGLTGDLDRRDDTIYPTDGMQLSLVLYGNQFDGLRTRDYQKGVLLYDTFHPLGDKGVLAARGALCGASDETPFFDLCSLGGTDAMRGFPVTQFLDNRLASAQVEYRRVFAGRLGGVVFAGAGMVGADTDELSFDDAHAAAGVGARIRLSRKFPVDFSIDASWNDEDEQLLYIYVGQRF
jgi:outer membrane protein assembly factor BamA